MMISLINIIDTFCENKHTMKPSIKTIIKQFSALLLIASISTTWQIQAMKPKQRPPKSLEYNNCITIKNDNPDTFMQVLFKRKKYDAYAKKYYPLNESGFIGDKRECRMERTYNDSSQLTLVDPVSQEKELFLSAYDQDLITIHAINNRMARVTVENNSENHPEVELGHFTYK